MNKNTKKNKKSRLAKGLLCFLLALCPMMMNVSKAQAEEVQKDSHILNVEEGKVWAEELGRGDGQLAKKSLRITKLNVNYTDDEYNTIDWKIEYNIDREPWGSYLFAILLPETNLKKTELHWVDEYWNKNWTDNADTTYYHKKKLATAYKYGYKYGTDDFNTDFWGIFQTMLQGSQSGSDMNTWRDTGRFSKMVFDQEGRGSGLYTVTFTTYHAKDTVLENVPLLTTMSNVSKGHRRLAGLGPFGIAAWHQLKIPKRVYVDDIDHLTQKDKDRIFGVIKEDTDKWLNTLENKERGEREENEAKVEIIDNTYVKTFSDGSKLKLSLRSFVRQRELNVLNQENVVNWKDSVDIALGVNDPEFKNEMIAMPAEGKLPAGLGWDETAITEDVPNGKIRGIPDIDWSKVAGTPGSKQFTFKFNLALRKEDGTINKRPETYKPITITVKQDEGAVPVGVEDFPTTPFAILSTLSLSMIGIIFWRRRVQE